MSVTRNHNDHIAKVLEKFQHREIQIGFFETAHYTDGTPIAYVAAIQEFGHGAIPPRPFLRPAAANNKDKWSKLISGGVKAALREAIQLDDALSQVGMVGAGDVQDAIKAVQSPPLALSTLILRKRKKEGTAIGGKEVGRAVTDAADTDSPVDVSGVSTKPLVDSGLMIQSVTYGVKTT